MRDHHQRIIEKLSLKYKEDKRFIALILVGSIAKGKDSNQSDVDIVLVATDEEFAQCKKAKAYHFFDFEISDYPEIYVDAKIVDYGFLVEAASRGNEPTRAGFTGAKIIFSRIPELDKLLEKIQTYPEPEQKMKLDAFYSQLEPAGFFAREAEERSNPYLFQRMITDVILFGCRVILAQNKVLFVSQKRLLSEVEGAENKPEGILEIANDLIANPSFAKADVFIDKILNYEGWEVKPDISIGTYIENDLWGWMNGNTSVGDW